MDEIKEIQTELETLPPKGSVNVPPSQINRAAGLFNRMTDMFRKGTLENVMKKGQEHGKKS